MTLTHIMPSLRRSLPDPLSRDLWPEHTTTSTTDVVVAGVSLLRLVDWCGTPCVHTAAAVIPGTGGRVSETGLASAIVTRVVAVELRDDSGIDVWVDAELDGCSPLLVEARLIGRVSTAHSVRVTLRPESVLAGITELPVDLVAGDLIAIPCVGTAKLRDVRRHAGHPERLSDDRLERGEDELPLPHCEK